MLLPEPSGDDQPDAGEWENEMKGQNGVCTDETIAEMVKIASNIAGKVGPLHGLWDIIFDAEALLQGKKTVATRDEIVQALKNAVSAQ